MKDRIIWLVGASAGIGESLAIRLAASCEQLVISARNAEALEKVKAQCGLASVSVMPLDVTDHPECLRVADEIVARFGRIDLVIANAGTYWATPVSELSHQSHSDIMAVNFGGLVSVTEAALPGLRAAVAQGKRGQLALTASVVGYRGLPKSSAYGASKAAAIHFAESIRFELELEGIDVTVINPGFVKTRLTDLNDFKMPYLISSEEAAEYIVNGLEKHAMEIHFPPKFSWALKFMRILPFSVYHRIVRRKVLKA
jgi:short-subunit dehydrogenase